VEKSRLYNTGFSGKTPISRCSLPNGLLSRLGTADGFHGGIFGALYLTRMACQW
jgi:hypothetical protein